MSNEHVCVEHHTLAAATIINRRPLAWSMVHALTHNLIFPSSSVILLFLPPRACPTILTVEPHASDRLDPCSQPRFCGKHPVRDDSNNGEVGYISNCPCLRRTKYLGHRRRRYSSSYPRPPDVLHRHSSCRCCHVRLSFCTAFSPGHSVRWSLLRVFWNKGNVHYTKWCGRG